jgi:hypothetical protein
VEQVDSMAEMAKILVKGNDMDKIIEEKMLKYVV